MLPDLVAAVQRSSGAVLVAPPGAGKTTRVPPALVDAGLGRVIVLEPRRVAARAAARRIAEERGWQLGREVGWQIRFERNATAETPLLVVTEGILVRMLQDDPFLDGVGAVVFDELHERSLFTDLSLAMTRRVQRDVRPDLAIVAMSATLDPGPVADFLDAPVVVSEGRTHPVDVRYTTDGAASAVRTALRDTDGDVLVFLSGVGPIRRLQGQLDLPDVDVLPLYGALPQDRQDAALRPGHRRRVVLSTNVAETSVTVSGVTAVVDTGLAKVMRHDPATGLDRLEEVRISRASADQRAGRAGRERPGVCYRLWTEVEHHRLPDRETPEIRRVDLAGTALELRAWGESDLSAFPWFEAPDPARLAVADALLVELGALDGGVTALGRAMARLPVHPRLARLVVEAHALGHPDAGALAAAVLSERDVFFGQERPAIGSDSDVIERMRAVERGAVPSRGVVRVAEQLARAARRLGPPGAGAGRDEAVKRALLAGFPDRVARRRSPGSPRAVMVGGRGVVLAPDSVVRDAELFVCVDVAGGAEARVRQASAVDRDWLDTERGVDVDYDPARGRVVALRRVRYRDLVLDEAVTAAPSGPEASAALARAVKRDPERMLGLADPPVASALHRIRSLAGWMPELGLPTFRGDDLDAFVDDLCVGRRTVDALRAALPDALFDALTWPQRQALDREAPERIEVPSGSRIRLTYEEGRPPVLAARIQELFGLAGTPRVAAGRVPVLLHLLAPNMRPQQVTDDLESFWDRTYPEVRKELAGRYPKHAWPEDPWRAQPMRGAKRRR